MAAGKLMVDEADELYAVWDGKPARSYGGTADVVAYAREHGTPVRVIWAEGAHPHSEDLRSALFYQRAPQRKNLLVADAPTRALSRHAHVTAGHAF